MKKRILLSLMTLFLVGQNSYVSATSWKKLILCGGVSISVLLFLKYLFSPDFSKKGQNKLTKEVKNLRKETEELLKKVKESEVKKIHD